MRFPYVVCVWLIRMLKISVSTSFDFSDNWLFYDTNYTICFTHKFIDWTPIFSPHLTEWGSFCNFSQFFFVLVVVSFYVFENNIGIAKGIFVWFSFWFEGGKNWEKLLFFLSIDIFCTKYTYVKFEQFVCVT